MKRPAAKLCRWPFHFLPCAWAWYVLLKTFAKPRSFALDNGQVIATMFTMSHIASSPCHLQSAPDEKRYLDEMCRRHDAFCNTPAFRALPKAKRLVLARKTVALRALSEIIAEQIAALRA